MKKSLPIKSATQALIAEQAAEIANLNLVLAKRQAKIGKLMGEAARADISASVRGMAIAQAVRQECLNSYSPDAHYWSEAMADIDLAGVIRSVAAPASIPQLAVPQGYKLVPIEPTHLMVGAGARAMLYAEKTEQASALKCTPIAYRAMIAAAPVAPLPELTGPSDPSALGYATEALRFYADQCHFTMHQPDAWDTVSGEPINFYEDESNTATVEDGSVAKMALETIAGAPRIYPAVSPSPAPAQPTPSPKEIVDRLLIGTASAKCPLCGISHPHSHSPLEIIIFRNGYKSGVRNASPWYDNQSDAQDGEAHATKFGGSVRPDANQHHEHRSRQPDANCADAGSDCGSAGVSRGGAIPEDRSTEDNAGRLAVGGAAPAQQQEPSASTDLSKRLRDYANASWKFSNVLIDKKDLLSVLDETDRYYGGMLAWKQTAETKDRKLSEEITARCDDRIAACLASNSLETAAPGASIGDDPELRRLVEFWAGKFHSSLAPIRDGHQKAWAELVAFLDQRGGAR
jgi:hypothetical protein